MKPMLFVFHLTDRKLSMSVLVLKLIELEMPNGQKAIPLDKKDMVRFLIDMSGINFIITRKEVLKSLFYQWLDEHPHFLFNPNDNDEPDKPMSRAEIAEYLGILTVPVTDWMKKGLPYKRMNVSV